MDTQQDEIIERFIENLKKRFTPELVLLFGSRAKKASWKRSDYDFIIVSRDFEGIPWLERIRQVVELWEPLIDIDILPYTPEEFEEKKEHSSTVRTAIKEGRSIVRT